MKKHLRLLWRENTGGSLVEYAFLLGLILLAAGAIVVGFSGATGHSLSRASHGVTSAMNSGSATAASMAKPSGTTLAIKPAIGSTSEVGKTYHFRF